MKKITIQFTLTNKKVKTETISAVNIQREWNGHNELTMPVWLAQVKNYMRTN